ncbi:MAG: hypothetical protein AVDCRST_MAG85-2269 [uncultured Solirubrobacteraceae bacterium]|uniref:Tetratricopeptide repeat protein n=1 Tax=uncultured Solirubrobacteraceae bacterium TaxID=1162706 RepID=A0A6J4SZV6_9ACTN|nr:MAG: hypothetical protein AVDCRST_MAG85-2269 [uncultured Solirubrobacteraceae bacterium]
MEADAHKVAMDAAIEAEGRAFDALLEGRDAAPLLRVAEASWRRSWETAPPRSYGRLIGMVKAAVLAGDAAEAAAYVRDAVGEPDSPPSAYALAITLLVEGDDAGAARAAAGMRGGSDAFDRTAEAIDALATGHAERYANALAAIVADFEQRTEHLTGVAIADTALMLERLAEPRGMAARPESDVLP